MASSTHVTGDAEQIRHTIAIFLQDRLQAKLDKLKEDDAARQKLLAEHEPQTWIADAARRVSYIQQVTHALKFNHPDAKGSSLSARGNSKAGELMVGSHTPAVELPPDVVGTAAALDVYKFLRLSVNGQALLDRAIVQDPALAAAFSENPKQAAEWMAAFATLPYPNGPPATHKLAKQMYWPLGDGNYHLLAPLFPTSLVHAIWAGLREDRFSDEAKAAREARREQRSHPQGFREYPNLVIQSFGGANPQSISQLNTERRGENWLLSSLPPTWRSEPTRPPFVAESVFTRHLFGSRPAVRELTRILRAFLISVAKPDRNNADIRQKRADLVDSICAELLQFASEMQALDAGWSQDARCRLNAAEQCWLDPKRAASDEEFAVRWRRGDWQDEICLRFGNWLNARISTEKTPMAQPEAEAWQAVLDEELSMIRLELADHD